MADPAPATPLAPATPPAHWAARFAGLAPAVALAQTPAASVVVRTDDPTAISALALPGTNRIRRSDDGTETVLWLGPDEWLLTRVGAVPHEWAATVAARAAQAADPDAGGCYTLDVSGQRTRLVLGGPYAQAILAHGCAIDLSPRAFGDDEVAQTLLAQAGVIIHRADPRAPGDGFVLYVRSSFADYLAGWLEDAATEYRPGS